MKRIAVYLAVLFVLVAALALPFRFLWRPEPTSCGGTLILPGRCLGPIDIGTPMDEARVAVAALGEIREAADGFANTGSGVGVYSAIAADWSVGHGNTPGFVYVVITDDPKYKTTGGLGVGSSFDDFMKAFGKPDNAALLPQGFGVAEWKRGLSVAVDVGTGEILAVTVFKTPDKK